MEQFAAWLAQLNWESLLEMLVTVAACVLCITFHETCHGLAAYALGDTTAKRAGRLTLNPLKHIDIFGLVMLAVAKFGWAKPVPVNMRNFRNPKMGMAITALAGPVSNVVLAAVAMLLYSVCFFYEIYLGSAFFSWLSLFFAYVMILSAGLAVFNLLPVPPLDGSKVLAAVLPEHWYYRLMRYERYGMVALMALLVTGVLDAHLSCGLGGLIDWMSGACSCPFYLLVSIYF